VLQTQFVNLRFADLRYFVAVAEELSFTRAAARLYVAQQALSAQVRQLERELGVQLLERTTRRIQLTEAGVVFLRHARSLLAAADAAVDETRRAVGAGRLRIGFMAGAALELTHPIIAEFDRLHPRVSVELHEHRVDQLAAGVREGNIDVALIRAPFTSDGLLYEVLAEEPRAITLPVGHPLTRKRTVSMPDIAGLPWVTVRTRDQVAYDFWLATTERGGIRPSNVLEVGTFEEQMEAVGAGRGVSITGASAARFYSRPDLVYRQFLDLAPSQIAVAWRRGNANPLVGRFVEIALKVRDAENSIVDRITHGGAEG
jgi:DNA-binding transcriptional LysR family regulator